MSEKISREKTRHLAASIWALGQVTMDHLFEIAPVPSIVKGEIEDVESGVCLEPAFLIDTPYPTCLEKLPHTVELTVNRFEAYARNPELTLYAFRSVGIDTRTYRRTYSEGVVILDGYGATIRPELERPAPNTHYRPGNTAWKNLRTESNLGRFGSVEADEFIDLATQFKLRHSLKD